jgi:hypothetical protein
VYKLTWEKVGLQLHSAAWDGCEFWIHGPMMATLSQKSLPVLVFVVIVIVVAREESNNVSLVVTAVLDDNDDDNRMVVVELASWVFLLGFSIFFQ